MQHCLKKYHKYYDEDYSGACDIYQQILKIEQKSCEPMIYMIFCLIILIVLLLIINSDIIFSKLSFIKITSEELAAMSVPLLTLTPMSALAKEGASYCCFNWH